jgi:hypothetical protein
MAHACQDSDVQQLHERSSNAHSLVPVTVLVKEARPRDWPHSSIKRGGYECDEYIHEIVHCMTLYKYSLLI